MSEEIFESKIVSLEKNGTKHNEADGYTIVFEDKTEGSCLFRGAPKKSVGETTKYTKHVQGQYTNIRFPREGGPYQGNNKGGGGNTNAQIALLAAVEHAKIEADAMEDGIILVADNFKSWLDKSS